jgi:hypothetical protein
VQTSICLSLDFSIGFLQKNVGDISMLIVFLLNCPNELYEFFTAEQYYVIHFFYWIFKEVYMIIEHQLSKGRVLRINYYRLIT